MSSDLCLRLEAVIKKVDLDSNDIGRWKTSRGGGMKILESRRILKKWKYKTRADKCRKPNSFLSAELQNFIPLYENVVDSASKQLNGFHLHSLKDLLDRCRNIQEGTNQMSLEWDAKWINPLTLASKGWDMCSTNGKSESGYKLLCKCNCCRSTMCLDLQPNENDHDDIQQSLNKRYWEKYIPNSHSQFCPWKKKQFDLENEYYLRDSNLLSDLQRIQKQAMMPFPNKRKEPEFHSKLLSETQMCQLIAYFNCRDTPTLLELSLRGYERIDERDDVSKCTRCFHKAFAKTILSDERWNCHAPWCRYFQEEKLPMMILELLKGAKDIKENGEASEDRDAQQQLIELERYFENI